MDIVVVDGEHAASPELLQDAVCVNRRQADHVADLPPRELDPEAAALDHVPPREARVQFDEKCRDPFLGVEAAMSAVSGAPQMSALSTSSLPTRAARRAAVPGTSQAASCKPLA